MTMIYLLVAFVFSVRRAAAGPQPNPPNFPASVAVFGPGDQGIQDKINAAFSQNGGHDPPNHGQWSDARFAFLFKPGKYDVDVPVGYYTTIAGLGDSPDDVVFTGKKGVYCEEGDYVYSDGALSTFWRSAENFQTAATFNWNTAKGMLWAVSQASPLRRVHVTHQLSLYEYQPPYSDAGYSSGGFMSSCVIDDTVFSGSQQQWFTRNCHLDKGWNGGVWNMVFVGVEGAPSSHCGNAGGSPYVTVDAAPLIAEKPFITVDGDGKFYLSVPPAKQAARGVTWQDDDTRKIPFEQVYVATPADSPASLNTMLATGLHLLLTPGIYNFSQPLVINTSSAVVLGIGFPTLIASAGSPVLVVEDDVSDVRVAGLLVQAGPLSTPTLIRWGSPSQSNHMGKTRADNKPSFLSDVFARVGGPDHSGVQATTMLQIYSPDVVGDNLWLWRADHGVNGEVKDRANPCDVGLQVEGDDVVFYGLAVEHTLGDLLQWRGERGQVFFYQSELPYDVGQQDYGDHGYVGYRVNDSVVKHSAWGLGVYHFFRDHEVTLPTAISTPAGVEQGIVAPVAVFLNGKGSVQHVLNNLGGPTHGPNTDVQYVCGG